MTAPENKLFSASDGYHKKRKIRTEESSERSKGALVAQGSAPGPGLDSHTELLALPVQLQGGELWPLNPAQPARHNLIPSAWCVPVRVTAGGQ